MQYPLCSSSNSRALKHRLNGRFANQVIFLAKLDGVFFGIDIVGNLNYPVVDQSVAPIIRFRQISKKGSGFAAPIVVEFDFNVHQRLGQLNAVRNVPDSDRLLLGWLEFRTLKGRQCHPFNSSSRKLKVTLDFPDFQQPPFSGKKDINSGGRSSSSTIAASPRFDCFRHFAEVLDGPRPSAIGVVYGREHGHNSQCLRKPRVFNADWLPSQESNPPDGRLTAGRVHLARLMGMAFSAPYTVRLR